MFQNHSVSGFFFKLKTFIKYILHGTRELDSPALYYLPIYFHILCSSSFHFTLLFCYLLTYLFNSNVPFILYFCLRLKEVERPAFKVLQEYIDT